MNNRDVAAAFDEIADLLEFQNANPFRVRAYRNAARRFTDLSEPLANVAADPKRDLMDIEGIGKDLAQKIAEFLETGTLAMLEQLRSEIPGGVLAMVRIPGVGPKKAAALHKELGITSLDALRAACEADRVQALKGFGNKTQEKILAGIAIAASAQTRMYWAHADEIVQELLAHMRQLKGIRHLEVAGSYRRGRETIGDVDLLVDADDAVAVMDHLARFEELATVIGRGDTKMSIRLGCGLQIDLRVVPAKSFGAALQYFTGSKDHNIVLRGMAKNGGLLINEYGVFRTKSKTSATRKSAPASAGGSDDKDEKFTNPNSPDYVAGRTEEEVYATLDLPWFPPEIREARQEFAWAAAGKLPDLIEVTDLVGDLHMHTTASDGKASLRDMAVAAIERGHKYIAITDHSPRVSMANGLDPKRLRKQWKEIDRLNDELENITILKGIECDILEKGGMDLPDDVLAEADWVIASVHYGQQQPREQITERILGAIENPHVSIIAHPTGRIIGRREPYAVDLERVFAAAARHGKLMEINANPARLDLDDIASAAAKRHGIPLVISSDAHSTGGLDVLRYGVLQARRAGLTAADVANTHSWKKIKSMIGNYRR
ncbi:MAG TPA: helix-hairpin-helix domain-containing protein [Lacipirellulaceae bacterium]|nr:helix-hairpin-helix domain-containing protein [Lacipirellulaceae bacterium]